jgi:hypothetical protein
MKFPVSLIGSRGPHFEQDLLGNLISQCLSVSREESCYFCVKLKEDTRHIYENHDDSPRVEVDAQL